MTALAVGQPVTLVQRTVTGQDEYGNDVYTETQLPTTGVFAPGGSTELTTTGDQVTTQPTLYSIPVDTDLDAVDAVLVNGQRYEIDGEPQLFQTPFTAWQPGLVVRLTRTTG